MRRAVLLTTALVVVFTLGTAPAARAATSAGAIQSAVLRLVNDARVDLGLRPLRADGRLGSLAVLRARWMAERGVLSHDTYGGTIGVAVTGAGVPWISVGENVARSSGPADDAAAGILFQAWRNSAPHWAAITSNSFNYVGVGVAFGAPGTDPFAAMVFAETEDRTAPVAAITGGRVVGQTVSWTWRGTEVALQTHTAGLCNFDVQYRVDAGPWRALWSRITRTALTLSARPRGHSYSIRVLARDCRGNASAFTAAKTLRVP